MAEPVSKEVIHHIDQAAGMYHRLIILLAPTGGGKTVTLQEVHRSTGAPLINVNLELSHRMLELTERQRSLRIGELLSDIVNAHGNDVILLDNIEILFDNNLFQDPLRLLKGISRNRTIVASWNGSMLNGTIIYAEPGHREYRRYPIQDFLVVRGGDTESCL